MEKKKQLMEDKAKREEMLQQKAREERERRDREVVEQVR
jgi:hypothetical protein